MSDNVYIKQIFVEDHSIDELDIENHQEFGFDYETHDDIVTIWEGHGRVDNEPVKIVELERVIEQFKKKGATHISLDYHCDHIGYDMTGYVIRLATDEEIDEHLGRKKKNSEKAKQDEIDRLKRKLKELENE